MASIDEMLFDALRRSNPIGRVIEDFKKFQPDLQAAGTAPTGAAFAFLGALRANPLAFTDDPEEQARAEAAAQRARLDTNDPMMQAFLAWEAGQGSPVARAMAANEAAAGTPGGGNVLTGLANTALDLTNLIPMPAGKAGKALEATRKSEKAAKLMAGVVDAGAGDDLAALIEDAGKALPLAPEKKDLAAYMKSLGLGKPEAVDNLPSPLVPERTPNLLQLARDGNGVVETNRLNLPLDPSIGDLRAQLRNAQMPQVAGANDLTAPSSLVPDKVPNLLRIAREAQGEKVPSLTAPVKGARAINARAGQIGLPESIPATELDKFLRLSESVVGDLPPEGASFWARNGIPNEQVPSLFEASRKAGAMGQNADALLPTNVDIPPVRMDGTIENTLVAIAYGKSSRALANARKNRSGEELLSRAAEIISLDPDKLAEAEKLIPGIGGQIGSLRTTISDSAPEELFKAIRKAVKDLDVDRANELVDLAPQYGVSSNQAQLALNSAASRGKVSLLDQAGLGSSVNLTPPGLNAAINLGTKALTTPVLGPAITGGVAVGGAGAVTGGIAGALATPEDRWGGAVKGAAGGAVLGGMLGTGTSAYGLRHVNRKTATNLMKHSWALARKDVVATTEASQGRSILPTPSQFVSLWKNQTVSTLRQFGQDGTWSRGVMDLLQGRDSTKLLPEITEQISDRMMLGEYERLSTPLQEILEQSGMKGYQPKLGMPMVESVAMHGLSRSKSVVGSALLSTFGPGNLLGGIAGALKGAALPEFSGAIRHANGALNRGFRETAFWDERNNKLIPLAIDAFKRLGYDLSNVPIDQLTRARVTQMYGAKVGAMWEKTAQNMVHMSESRVRYLFGDYTPGQKGAIGIIEKITGPGMPFSSWAIRAYPVALDMAIQNPWVALGVYQFLQATSAGAGKDGRPRWTAGKLPISTEFPVLGAGARTLLGGQKGTAYVDPVGSLSPVGGDLFQPGADQEGPQSLYQQVSEIIGRAGLPGLSPIAQGIAYMLGLDYKGPGNMSRTQGMENSLGLIPGNIDLPGWGDVALRAGRAKLSPAFAGTELGAKLGATGDKYPTVYDPVARRFGELVVKETGFPLDDERNRPHLYDLAAGTGELYDQARREVLLGGLARNAFSTTSPIGVATQGEGAREAKREREGVPYDYTALQAIKALDIPSFMREAELQNRQYKEANPASASYAVGSRQEAEDILMQDVLDRFRGKRPPSPAAQQQQLSSILAAAGRGAQYRNLTPLPTEPVTMPAPRRIAPEPKK